MSEKLKVVNWEKWQTYRKDRGQPPWIKLHRSLLRNFEWLSMTDAQRGQLLSMWLLAADDDGLIPHSNHFLRKILHFHKSFDVQLFIDKGFLTKVVTKNKGLKRDAKVTPKRRQRDAPKAETEAETEAEKIRHAEHVVTDEKLILDYFNKTTNSSFRSNSNLSSIRGRLNEGYSVDDCKRVVDLKQRQWAKDPKTSKYLRPETLFAPKKFEGYLMESKRTVTVAPKGMSGLMELMEEEKSGF